MRVCFILALCLTSFQIYGQQAEMHLIGASGDVFLTQNESLSFSVGEVITETFSANNLILTQGFLQANRNVLNIQSNLNNNSFVNIYPNPAIDKFVLEIDMESNIEFEDLVELRIVDLYGRIITKRIIRNFITEVDVSNFQPEIYLVQISHQKNGFISTFLLQKVNH